MALRALQRRVRSRQCESSRGVVKAGIPVGGGMTALAGLRKASLHVVGIGRSLKIFQVARDAGCVRNVVVVVDMALRALQRHVRAREREAGLTVIEGCS